MFLVLLSIFCFREAFAAGGGGGHKVSPDKLNIPCESCDAIYNHLGPERFTVLIIIYLLLPIGLLLELYAVIRDRKAKAAAARATVV